MKNLIHIILFFAFTTINGQSRKVMLKLEETRSYCSGAVATEGMAQDIKQRRPFANKMIYVYLRGKCVDSVRTDSAGNLTLKLKRKKYGLFLPWKHFKKVPFGELSDYDLVCLKKEWQLPDAVLEIKKTDHVFTNTRLTHQFCEWQYNCLKVRRIPPGSQG